MYRIINVMLWIGRTVDTLNCKLQYGMFNKCLLSSMPYTTCAICKLNYRSDNLTFSKGNIILFLHKSDKRRVCLFGHLSIGSPCTVPSFHSTAISPAQNYFPSPSTSKQHEQPLHPSSHIKHILNTEMNHCTSKHNLTSANYIPDKLIGKIGMKLIARSRPNMSTFQTQDRQ